MPPYACLTSKSSVQRYQCCPSPPTVFRARESRQARNSRASARRRPCAGALLSGGKITDTTTGAKNQKPRALSLARLNYIVVPAEAGIQAKSGAPCAHMPGLRPPPERRRWISHFPRTAVCTGKDHLGRGREEYSRKARQARQGRQETRADHSSFDLRVSASLRENLLTLTFASLARVLLNRGRTPSRAAKQATRCTGSRSARAYRWRRRGSR